MPDDPFEGQTGLKTGRQEYACANGGVGKYRYPLSMSCLADAHKFGNARMSHFRLDDLQGIGIETEPGLMNRAPLLSPTDRSSNRLGHLGQPLDVFRLNRSLGKPQSVLFHGLDFGDGSFRRKCPMQIAGDQGIPSQCCSKRGNLFHVSIVRQF